MSVRLVLVCVGARVAHLHGVSSRYIRLVINAREAAESKHAGCAPNPRHVARVACRNYFQLVLEFTADET